MAAFYYDSQSRDSAPSQWVKHLQANAYIKNIGTIVGYNIQNASRENTKAIQQVCGSLDDGFFEITQHLTNINFSIKQLSCEINEMASMLDWHLSKLVEGQRLTNHLLGHIQQLLRIPDSQKQRVYHIEQGLKYLKNAFLEGTKSEFYIDSLESFKKAEKIESKDYITLNRIGQIYLYSEKFLDFSLAEKYFLKSARESFAEFNAQGTTTSNALTPYGYEDFIYSANPFKVATAEAYLYAGRTCYLQQKLSDAAKLAGKAFALIPIFLEAGFEKAKYLAADNKLEKASEVLEKVINKDRYFALKTINEKDLSNKKPIQNLLERLQKQTISAAALGLKKPLKIMSPNSEAKSVISEIKNEISKNNFLSGMKALDLLNAKYSLPYKINKEEYGEIIRQTVLKENIILDFLRKENYSNAKFKKLMQKLSEKHLKWSIKFFGIVGCLLGFIVGLLSGCTRSGNWFARHYTVDWSSSMGHYDCVPNNRFSIGIFKWIK